MERRAASHTEEEEMNQRRRLLNAAKKGDQKAIAKLFELYQVRVYNNEMVSKLNRKHMLFAWLSLFWVGFADFYVRMCSMGVINDLRIF